MNNHMLNFPLIAPKHTSAELKEKACSGSAVYFGTGITTTKGISHNLPFDFLNMLFTAEWVRRKTGARKIIHEISDFHASATCGKETAKGIANQQRGKLLKLATGLDLQDIYECVLASEYREREDFKDIKEEIAPLISHENIPYVRHQSEGNLYFSKRHNVGHKIGWLIDDKNNNARRDERFFNEAYDQLNIQPLCFIYTWSGWCFNEQRTRVCPYATSSEEERLMLHSPASAFHEIQMLMDSCTSSKISYAVIRNLNRLYQAYNVLWKKSDYNYNQEINLPALTNWIDQIRSLMSQEELPVDFLPHSVQPTKAAIMAA